MNARTQDFWRRMAERIGQRWYEDFGTKPTAEWCTLLTRYTDAVITQFFNTMPVYAHPPNLTMVAKELETISRRSAADSVDHVRGYWRSCVQSDLESMGALAGVWPYRTPLHLLPIEIRSRVLKFAVQLTEDLYTNEKQFGARTSAMLDYCVSRCWEYTQRLASEREHKMPPDMISRGAA